MKLEYDNSGSLLPKQMKLYLAGPMQDWPDLNFPAFDYASEKLRQIGFEVFSPAENDRDFFTRNKRQPTRRECFATDTRIICEWAEGIALLPYWEKSSGATAEHALAKALGHTIIILGKDFVNVT